MGGLAERAVESAYGVYGFHPGLRALHAKGTWGAGSFVASPAGAALTTAEHLQGDAIETTVRFSKGSGDPGWPDASRDSHGLALKFHLPSGADTDIVAATLPAFFVRRPEDFPRIMRALRPVRRSGRAPNPLRVASYALRHRESADALWSVFSGKPPVSVATLRYNALHAYRWIDPAGDVRHVRYSWLPEAGEQRMRRRAAKRRGADYLREELEERLSAGPVRFTLQIRIAQQGDPLEDPTAQWPSQRETVDVGTLSVERTTPAPEPPGAPVAFDPTRITDGIELSADPVLRFRREAYELSAARRATATTAP
jgi:catalase